MEYELIYDASNHYGSFANLVLLLSLAVSPVLVFLSYKAINRPQVKISERILQPTLIVMLGIAAFSLHGFPSNIAENARTTLQGNKHQTTDGIFNGIAKINDDHALLIGEFSLIYKRDGIASIRSFGMGCKTRNCPIQPGDEIRVFSDDNQIIQIHKVVSIPHSPSS